MAARSSRLRHDIVAAGLVSLLTALLKPDQLYMHQAHAASAMSAIALIGPHGTKVAIIAAGALPMLTALLATTDDHVRQEAACAYNMLACGCYNNNGNGSCSWRPPCLE